MSGSSSYRNGAGTQVMTAFKGFPEKLPEFLEQLRSNNKRDWFEANRKRFEALCVDPCLSFIETVSGRMSEFDPPHKSVARTNGSLRRIHRDTRFSKDKTPYHAFLHLIFWTGSHPNRSPGLHLVFSPGGFGIGAGYWQFDAEELTRYRAAVQDEKKLDHLLDAIALAKKAGCHLEAPALKRIPKDVSANERNGKLLRQKGIVVRNRNEAYPDGFFDERCEAVLLTRLSNLLSMQKWLVDNVCPSN